MANKFGTHRLFSLKLKYAKLIMDILHKRLHKTNKNKESKVITKNNKVLFCTYN